jgi:hypothetical protein
VFHVKRFGTMDALCKCTFARRREVRRGDLGQAPSCDKFKFWLCDFLKSFPRKLAGVQRAKCRESDESRGKTNVMARDEGLDELLREYLEAAPGLTEKAMFGGRAWLVNGNLLCAARDDGMLVRLGRDKDGWALEVPDSVPMTSRGRRMHGWVRAGSDAFGDDVLRRKLVDAALAFVSSLPAK